MKLGCSVRFVCNVNVVDESFVWWLTPVEGSLFQVSKPAFQGQSLEKKNQSSCGARCILPLIFQLDFFHSRTAEGKYCLYPTREQGEREACVPRRLTPVFLARNKII